ncbi:MAG: DHA2 family efflux MFS transporter permease subunit [Legionellales bacterium]|nr:DHA2 family efflux MFS transporter permease subunit [Legionellales bacterium]
MTEPTYVIDPFERWMITIAVMLVAVVEVIDMTIVNVALPNMQGALGANTDQITWVLTSYIVSSAICMPLTGFLVTRLGRKRLLLINIVGFLASSMLCGMSVSLPQMVFFRILQGIFGATLVPMSQYILRDTFPKNEQGKAMAIWGIGIMAGPILGPTIGGYITDALNWRWIFYVNIPVCIMAFFMTLKFITETPRSKPFIDWFGLFLMAMGIGTLQIFLDEGNEYNWLDSNGMVILFVMSLYFLSYFVIRGWNYRRNIINLHLFKDHNLTMATILLTLYCMLVFGLLTLQPIMMQDLLNYPVLTTGIVMAPRGFSSGFSMFVVSKLMGKVDLRIIIVIGLLLSAAGTYGMTQYSLYISEPYLIWTGVIQGFGMGLIFVPLSTLALATISREQGAEASGLFSFGRSIGSSIGISALSTVLAQESQINWNRLGGNLNAANPALYQWITAHQLSLSNPLTAQLLGADLNAQSSMIAFVDCYYLIFLAFLAMIPMVFLLRQPQLKTFDPAVLGH